MKNIINRALAAEKKLFTLLLAVAASVGTMFAWDYEGVKIGDLYYNLDATNRIAEVSRNTGVSGDIVIPSSVTFNAVAYSVTSIGDDAFAGCSGLTSITIPNSVTSIGFAAFHSCSGLTSIALGNGVKDIKYGAFYACSALTRIDIPNSVTNIEHDVFDGCSSLTSIVVEGGNTIYDSRNNCNAIIETATNTLIAGCMNTIIPGSITSIGNNAFSGCTGLTSIDIPNSITSIGDGAFAGCSGLTSPVYNAHVFAFIPTAFSGEYTIPKGIESIAGYAFYNCTGLTSVTIPNSVTSIGYAAFEWCTGLTSMTIPNSVTSIGEYAFSRCTGLTSPVYNAHVFAYLPTSYSGAYTIPDGIESIAGGAFAGCSGLTSVTIPNSVTIIGESAFNNCSGLASVTIGNSVINIGSRAFYICSGLTSIYNYAITPQVIDATVFEGDSWLGRDPVDKSKCKLYVLSGSINAYKVADQWKDFTNILPISAEEAETNAVQIEPTDNSVSVTWPQVTGAATYTIEIKKNGELICTLTFNAQGQLISIAFNAPSRNNAPQRAQAAGFSFTVTSLDSGTTYSYTMTAKDNNGNVLKTESGTFSTTGEAQGIEEISSSLQGGDRGRLIYHNGQIFILRGDKTYTLQGQEVR